MSPDAASPTLIYDFTYTIRMSPAHEVPLQRRRSPLNRVNPHIPLFFNITTRCGSNPQRPPPAQYVILYVLLPQRLPFYSLRFWTAAAPIRSDSHPAAGPTFFLINLLNKRHKSLHATTLATFSVYLVRIFRKQTSKSFIRKTFGAAAGWESLRVGAAAVQNVKE